MDIQDDSKLLSGFPFTDHGNPDNNIESPCDIHNRRQNMGKEGDETDCTILGCEDVQSGIHFPIFRKNAMLLYSEWISDFSTLKMEALRVV
jgi:hypothetical protein